MPKPGELEMVAPRRQKPPLHWSDLTVDERKEKVVELGLPAFRADQISRQFFGRLSNDPQSWTDIPAELRPAVQAQLFPELLTSVKAMDCDGGTTVKQVWKLFDGAMVESVLMRYTDRVTMCISSQAGCGMNCPFCATGQNGLTRNLSTAEIVEQILVGARALANDEIAGGVGRVNNIVFMGMGEPMANYKNVIAAIRRFTDDSPAGIGLSARGITLSTVGLVPRIYDLAKEGIPVTLAVSLHCPDDELRDTLVPINNRFKINEVLDACWNYADITGRRVSIEYALIKDINDQAWRAELLGKLLQGNLVHVNLIPLNPTPGSIWTASRPEDERAFLRILHEHGVAATVRDTRGREIDGACGQLAASV